MTQKKLDEFAQIATNAINEREALQPQHAPQLSDKCLPSQAADTAKFSPRHKMSTWDEVKTELTRLREQFLPFMEDHAPAIESNRKRVDVVDFDWREATVKDGGDFLSVLAGEGAWQAVTIPHYGGPLGRATTLYRTTIVLDESMHALGALFLRFKAVDYKAHVFLNGNFLGSHEGFFAPFEFDCTAAACLGENVLVIKVENDAIHRGNDLTPYQGDKIYAATGVGYDDPEAGWHHCPPGMGIYHDVYFEARSRVHVHDLFVRCLEDRQSAEATIEVWNCDKEDQPLAIELSIYGQNFQATVCESKPMGDVGDLGPTRNEYKVTFEVPEARLWSNETPWLYQIQVVLKDQTGAVVDCAATQFGLRTFTMEAVEEPKGRMYLNDVELRLRGANTMGHMQQCVVQKKWDQLIDDILLAKLAHMNFYRLTQRPVQKEIYEYCDRLGMMTQTDLPYFGVVRRNKQCEGIRQAEEMERHVRNHPCNIMVSYMNEPFANCHGKPHRFSTRAEMDAFFTACDQVVLINNPDRVIKHVDGDYDPPARGLPDTHCYNTWYNGHALDLGAMHKGHWVNVKPGWRYACGEFGAEGLEDASLMKRHYPKSWLPDSPEEEATWTPASIVRAQSGNFHYMWFDSQETIEDWVDASQAHQAWGVKVMTEAFRRDSRMNSFALHLFIDAFPSGWMKTVMDFERRPKQAFYVWREALTPLMVNLRSDRQQFYSEETVEVELWICNDTHDTPEATVAYQLYYGETLLQAGEQLAEIGDLSSVYQGAIKMTLPRVTCRTNLRLEAALVDAAGNVLHDTSFVFAVFEPLVCEHYEMCVLGDASGVAQQLAEKVDATIVPLENASIILIDDYAAYQAAQQAVEMRVKQGARCLFLNLQAGEYTIAGDAMEIRSSSMNPVHFVSRKTGHPFVAEFQPNDFRFWYDEAVEEIRPLLSNQILAKNWTPILKTGGAGIGEAWNTAVWGSTMAVADKCQEQGRWIVSELDLIHRLSTSPVARQFLARLLC